MVRTERGLVALPSSAHRHLLELLALHAGEPVPVDMIAADLWPDSPQPEPADLVRPLLQRLRMMLAELGAPALPLYANKTDCLLDVPPESVDALHMVALVDRARSAPGGVTDSAVRTLDQALSLWRGEPFGGNAIGRHHAKAARRWREVRFSALCAWANAQLWLGRPEPVIARLRAERVADFAREELYVLLLRALNQVGDKIEASAVHRFDRRPIGPVADRPDTAQGWSTHEHPADWQ